MIANAWIHSARSHISISYTHHLPMCTPFTAILYIKLLVRFLMNMNLLPERISARGLGGLRSNQIVSCDKQTINCELSKNDEMIIHIGNNDVSKGVKQEEIT